MSVRVEHGDSRDVLKTLPDASVDSCVTDTPYALVSIVKRFGKDGAAPAQEGRDGLYKRASAGFMGKRWDTGETAHDPAFWREVYRVLKPGGHLIAFGGTRTSHRMVAAIEDAGFEIRDEIANLIASDGPVQQFLASLNQPQVKAFFRCVEESGFGGRLEWIFGSGFPKSHDVSKGIDRRGGAQVAWFGPWLRQFREERGIKQSEIAALFPSKTGQRTGCAANWELGLNMPTPEQFNLICSTFGLPFDSLEAAERAVISHNDRPAGWFAEQSGHDVTAPSSDPAKQWQGWGTALKPAHEPICLARKPLSGTVAETVLQHGTGALNIDGCRVHCDDAQGGEYTVKRLKPGATLDKTGGNWRPEEGPEYHGKMKPGRWPANVIHDGSEEVLAAFPDSESGIAVTRNGGGRRIGGNGIYGGSSAHSGIPDSGYDDGGSAARFFYSAKADAEDRFGSKHPTVKPIDLIAYLCRLVTPPGGTVLDPFAGSGTTGTACLREGFDCILIEREAEYIPDIMARIELASGEGRHPAVIKHRNVDPAKARGEDLPMFSTVAAQ